MPPSKHTRSQTRGKARADNSSNASAATPSSSDDSGNSSITVAVPSQSSGSEIAEHDAVLETPSDDSQATARDSSNETVTSKRSRGAGRKKKRRRLTPLEDRTPPEVLLRYYVAIEDNLKDSLTNKEANIAATKNTESSLTPSDAQDEPYVRGRNRRGSRVHFFNEDDSMEPPTEDTNPGMESRAAPPSDTPSEAASDTTAGMYGLGLHAFVKGGAVHMF